MSEAQTNFFLPGLRSAAIAANAPARSCPQPTDGLSDTSELRDIQNPSDDGGPKSLVALLQKAFGRNRPELAKVLHKQAITYHKLGKFDQAEFLYRRSLAIAEKAFRENDIELASILNNLARLLQDLQRYDEAIPLYQRSLDIVKVTFGPDHPKVARRLRNLADLYRSQGCYTEAEALLQRSRI